MSKTILIIEDEPTLQKTLSLSLSEDGFEVKSALDGQTGLKTAKDSPPDLILLDLILPKMDGFEVLTELKKDPNTQEVPVIVLTNLESTKDIEQALALGAHSYLVKASYDLSEVLTKIKNTLK